MTELVVGKYEFYPYPQEVREPRPTLEELVKLLREDKAKSEKDVTVAGLPQHWHVLCARNSLSIYCPPPATP